MLECTTLWGWRRVRSCGWRCPAPPLELTRGGSDSVMAGGLRAHGSRAPGTCAAQTGRPGRANTAPRPRWRAGCPPDHPHAGPSYRDETVAHASVIPIRSWGNPGACGPFLSRKHQAHMRVGPGGCNAARWGCRGRSRPAKGYGHHPGTRCRGRSRPAKGYGHHPGTRCRGRSRPAKGYGFNDSWAAVAR
jgi:hypothetical protein